MQADKQDEPAQTLEHEGVLSPNNEAKQKLVESKNVNISI